MKMKSLLATLALLAQAVSCQLTIRPDIDHITDQVVKLIRSITEGFNLYEHVKKLSVCDHDTDNFFEILFQSTGIFIESELEPGELRKGTWALTDSLGLSSYAIRSCYTASQSIEELYEHYIDQFGNFPEAASDFHNNIIKSADQLNDQGWTSYVGFYMGRYEDFAFGISRSIYLTTLQTHFSTYVPSKALKTEHLEPQEIEHVTRQHKSRQNYQSSEEMKEHPQVKSVYPFPKITFNNFHYGLELTYEFVRGARVVPKAVLDTCETRITNYMLNLAYAQDYIDLGYLLEDKDIIIEGHFRIFDTFLLLTDLAQGCWETYWRVGQSLRKLIAVNILTETQAFMNLITEYFLLSNNMATFFADYFFADWLSFAYYAGDTIYRIIVAQNKVDFDWKTYE